MKEDSISKQLIRLSYAEIILHHAEVDSAANFIENLKEDLNSDLLAKDVERNLEEEAQSENESSSKTADKEDISQKYRTRSLISRLKANKPLAVLSAVALVLVLPALFILLWSNIHYKDKILPGTQYASIKLSSNPEEALKQIKEASSSYKYTLKFNETNKIYAPEEVGIKVDAEATVEAAKQKSNQVRFFARPFALISSRTVQSSVNLDQDKLRAFLETQNYSDKLPEDAKIEFNSESSKYVAVPEVAGRGIDSKSLATKLENSASDLNAATIDLNIEDVTPSITSKDLQEPIAAANSLISQKISITSPSKNYSPTASVMKDWVALTPDPDNLTYQVSLNEKSQKDYIDSIVSKVNRKMEKRLYATIDGSELLLQQGAAGIQVTNVDSAKSQLVNLVKSKQGGTITLEAREEAPSSENIAASGGRWIFADLSQFRVFAYEGSTLVNSFAMSSGKSSTPTPTGNYSVMSKVRVKTMTSGGNKNSKDYYSVPNIEWVAYFKSGGYAMHGVYWHNKFGIENTSHGCMGMSNASAQWVYNFVDIGTPVIIIS